MSESKFNYFKPVEPVLESVTLTLSVEEAARLMWSLGKFAGSKQPIRETTDEIYEKLDAPAVRKRLEELRKQYKLKAHHIGMIGGFVEVVSA